MVWTIEIVHINMNNSHVNMIALHIDMIRFVKMYHNDIDTL